MFSLDEEQLKKIALWTKELDKDVIAKQKETMSPEDFSRLTQNGTFPYYGAIGGSLTYSFTNTSLGQVVKVTHAYTEEVLDVTDYDSW